MQLNWFKSVKTLDDCRKLYKKLCKELHPDNGGNSADFVSMRSEFEYVFDKLKESVDHDSDEYRYAGSASVYADMIEKLQKTLFDVEIEQCGSWLYLHGQGTINCKETIKLYGFRWSNNKKAWYWFEGIENTKKRRGHFSMDAIRTIYGSETYKSQSQYRIAN